MADAFPDVASRALLARVQPIFLTFEIFFEPFASHRFARVNYKDGLARQSFMGILQFYMRLELCNFLYWMTYQLFSSKEKTVYDIYLKCCALFSHGPGQQNCFISRWVLVNVVAFIGNSCLSDSPRSTTLGYRDEQSAKGRAAGVDRTPERISGFG